MAERRNNVTVNHAAGKRTAESRRCPACGRSGALTNQVDAHGRRICRWAELGRCPEIPVPRGGFVAKVGAGGTRVEYGVEVTASNGHRRVNRYPKTSPERLRERIATEVPLSWENGMPIEPRVVTRTVAVGPWLPVDESTCRDAEVNQLQALRETVRLAEERGVPEMPGSDLGLEHLRKMAAAVEAGRFSEAKLGRWLGWAQCAVVAANVGVTLADVKAINIRHAGEDRPG